MATTQQVSWPDYLRGAMTAAGYRTGGELARASGIGEAQISRWLRGQNQPDLPNLRRLSTVLKRPYLEVLVAAGHITPAEARMSAPPAPPEAEPDALALIAADKSLSEAQKALLTAAIEEMRRNADRGSTVRRSEPAKRTS